MFEESEWLWNSSHCGNGTWSLSPSWICRINLGPEELEEDKSITEFLASLALLLSSPHSTSCFVPLSFLLLSTSDRSGKNTADSENQAVCFPPWCRCCRLLLSRHLLALGRVWASVLSAQSRCLPCGLGALQSQWASPRHTLRVLRWNA